MGWSKQGKAWQWWVFAAVVAGVALSAVVSTVIFSHARKHHKIPHHPAPPYNGSSPGETPPGSSPAAVPVTSYGIAAKIAIKFFDVQKSGKLPKDNPIPWRGDSALRDGSDVGIDLVGGVYDAGDHVKFGLPMAFTGTMLGWSILEYGSQYSGLGLLDTAKGELRWITDYLIKAHTSPDELYFQVGNPAKDHECWERAESMNSARPSYKITATNPGSDVAGETAAAMAAASLVFKRQDMQYSQKLLNHAKQLFTFADTYRGSYSHSFPSEQGFYNSTGIYDELLWAASWLYFASNEETYLSYATGQNGQLYGGLGKAPAWFSWDDKHPGIQVLLSRSHLLASKNNAGLTQFKSTADDLMCALLPDSPSATHSRTIGGMIWITEWNSIQHAVNSAFLALVYSDYLLSIRSTGFTCSGKYFQPNDLRKFAQSQADYVLGKNPLGISYLVGYGAKFPQHVHHRGASIPMNSSTYGCKEGFQWLQSPSANPNLAIGALVGGPFQNDSYSDTRKNTMQNEPTIYNTATLLGLLVGLSNTGALTIPKVF